MNMSMDFGTRAIEPDAQTDLQERLLDEALAETFPASDPISPSHIG